MGAIDKEGGGTSHTSVIEESMNGRVTKKLDSKEFPGGRKSRGERSCLYIVASGSESTRRDEYCVGKTR
jgi:hypothetical protein